MQVIQLSTLTDSGVWISDDRVNAFISSTCHGIGEIGYHGQQPVSRNSRLLSGENGVLQFFYRVDNSELLPIVVDEIEWYPGGIRIQNKIGDGKICIDVVAVERSIFLSSQCSIDQVIDFILCFNTDSLFRNVHGERIWQPPQIKDNHLYLSCHDRIILKDWICRTGPYAGDFIIPEPWRRVIFKKQCRSGLATLDDVHPEYRDADIPLYDAKVFMRVGGSNFLIDEKNGKYFFTTRCNADQKSSNFIVQFSDHELFKDENNVVTLNEVQKTLRVSGLSNQNDIITIIDQQKSFYKEIQSKIPKLILTDFPHIENFLSTVPGLVESCRVKDHGTTRANPGAYYWIWAWDNIVTSLEMTRWGDLENLRRVAQFINAHRDVNGLIPGRWTHSLLPLDTPIRGSMEFLFALLSYELALQTDDQTHLIDAYPFLVEHLQQVNSISDECGCFVNIGSYPDLPIHYGRTEQSIVAMEVAAHYSFCRLMENIALPLHDNATAQLSHDTATRIQSHFLHVFWDEQQKFIFDSFDAQSGERNESYPSFIFLFLQTPLGFSLLHHKINDAADFISKNLLSQNGIRLLPAWDQKKESESVTNAWYPHWDIYMIKFLRRAGRANEIMQWLSAVEKTLIHLGYCPEFLSFEGFENDDENPWRFHGAVSNLNCATGWYRALLEGVIGLEFDPGGMTVIPLSLPIKEIQLTHLYDRGTIWDVMIKNEGEYLNEIRVDDQLIAGCLKIPYRFYDNGRHTLDLRYGVERQNGICIHTLINAQLLEIRNSMNELHTVINCLGTVDLSFFSPYQPELLVDGIHYSFQWNNDTNNGMVQLPLFGIHEIDLQLTTKFQ